MKEFIVLLYRRSAKDAILASFYLLYFRPFSKVSSDTHFRVKKTVLDVKNPIFHSSDKSQSDFSRLTSEKIALTSEKNTSTSEKRASTSEKHELHKIWDATLTQLGFQCASDVSSAALSSRE